jgi:hypothetical protein
MNSFVNHLAADSLLPAVEAEAPVASLPEALAMQEAIFTAVRAYYGYLDRYGMMCSGDRDLMREATLHVDCDTRGTKIYSTDREIDRRFLAVSTRKILVSPPRGRSQKFRRRGARGPVHARQRLFTQFRLAAAKVKR